jgi:hypothetical protein
MQHAGIRIVLRAFTFAALVSPLGVAAISCGSSSDATPQSGSGGGNGGGLSGGDGGKGSSSASGIDSGQTDAASSSSDSCGATRGQWTSMSQNGAPVGASLFWSNGLVVAKGLNATSAGGVYSPCTDSWRPMANAPAGVGDPFPIFVTAAGDFYFYFFGSNTTSLASYDPSANTWRQLSSSGALTTSNPASVYTGSSWVQWGGTSITSAGLTQFGNLGAVYDVAHDQWHPTSISNAPSGRGAPVAWTGKAVAIWGGQALGVDLGDGALYDPALDRWTAMSQVGAPTPRNGHVFEWTGKQLLVWGGNVVGGNSLGAFVDGALYDPSSDAWSPTAQAPFAANQTGVILWSGTRLVVFDGTYTGTSGWIYDPLADRWSSIAAPPQPLTCSGLRVQAGALVGGCLPSSGGSAASEVAVLLAPETNTWSVVPMPAGVPHQPQILWTGGRWIVWGGYLDGPLTTCTAGAPTCDPTPTMIVTALGWTMVP